jgi:hypothetical protein
MRGSEFGLAATLLLLTSCDHTWTDDYDFVWHGEHVTVYGYDHTEADACGGSFAELDGHAGMIKRDLGIEHAPAYTYRWLSYDYWEQLEDDNPCFEHAACARSGEAISRLLPHGHELVHSVTHYIGSDGCPQVLNEGLAMYYNEYPPTSTEAPMLEDASIREILANGLDGDLEEFGVTLHFVAFLAETYGPKSIVELCEALPKEPAISMWDEAIRSVYGITLEQLLEQFEEYPTCSYEHMRARLWGCSAGPAFPFWEAGDEYVVETGCDDPQATNSAWGENKAVLERRVYLGDDMELRIMSDTIGVGAEAIHMIQECAPCSENPDVFVEIPDDPFTEVRMYRAGVHEVMVIFDKDTNVRLSITADEY